MSAPPPFQSKHPPTSFYRSVLHAWNGLIHTVVHQRNMRMHLISGLLVGLVGSGIPLGLAEKVTLVFCVLLVLFAEMLNSAMEQLVDLAIQQFDEKAKLTKDIAAAAVLVLAIGTVVLFAVVLVHNAEVIFANLPAIERQVLFGAPLVFLGGALMHEQVKPVWLDVLFAIGALVLWGFIASWSESEVFSAMTLGLLFVCMNAAYWRQSERRRSGRRADERS
jgi:diacylglycerol kinase (ATP)